MPSLASGSAPIDISGASSGLQNLLSLLLQQKKSKQEQENWQKQYELDKQKQVESFLARKEELRLEEERLKMESENKAENQIYSRQRAATDLSANVGGEGIAGLESAGGLTPSEETYFTGTGVLQPYSGPNRELYPAFVRGKGDTQFDISQKQAFQKQQTAEEKEAERQREFDVRMSNAQRSLDLRAQSIENQKNHYEFMETLRNTTVDKSQLKTIYAQANDKLGRLFQELKTTDKFLDPEAYDMIKKQIDLAKIEIDAIHSKMSATEGFSAPTTSTATQVPSEFPGFIQYKKGQ